ncbi:hypothetical protein ABBQ32_006352 [Trebouxia sp. C0010 RCD-2024]
MLTEGWWQQVTLPEVLGVEAYMLTYQLQRQAQPGLQHPIQRRARGEGSSGSNAVPRPAAGMHGAARPQQGPQQQPTSTSGSSSTGTSTPSSEMSAKQRKNAKKRQKEKERKQENKKTSEGRQGSTGAEPARSSQPHQPSRLARMSGPASLPANDLTGHGLGGQLSAAASQSGAPEPLVPWDTHGGLPRARPYPAAYAPSTGSYAPTRAIHKA